MNINHHLYLPLLALSLFSSCRRRIETGMTHAKKPADYILTVQNTPTAALQRLLQLTEVTTDGSLQDIVAQTQKQWLRAAGKERWEVGEFETDKKEEIIDAARQAGFIDEVKPQKSHYDYVILMGATAPRVRRRLDYVFNLWNRGVTFDRIVMLGGERELNKELEADLIDTCHTEYDMMQHLYRKANRPDGLDDAVEVSFINAKKQPTSQGGWRRPNTADTVQEWLKTNPHAGSCLVISDNPHVPYQDAVMRSLMPDTFSVETVGERATPKVPLSTILDSMARTLYTIYQAQK